MYEPQLTVQEVRKALAWLVRALMESWSALTRRAQTYRQKLCLAWPLLGLMAWSELPGWVLDWLGAARAWALAQPVSSR